MKRIVGIMAILMGFSFSPISDATLFSGPVEDDGEWVLLGGGFLEEASGLEPNEGDVFYSGIHGSQTRGISKIFDFQFAATTYTVTFYAGRRDGIAWVEPWPILFYDANENGAFDWDERVSFDSLQVTIPDVGEWAQVTATFTVDETTVTGGGGDLVLGENLGLAIRRGSMGSDAGVFIDGPVTIIPEPGTMALLLAGMAGIFARRRFLVG